MSSETAKANKKAFVPKQNKVFVKNLAPETTSEIRHLLFNDEWNMIFDSPDHLIPTQINLNFCFDRPIPLPELISCPSLTFNCSIFFEILPIRRNFWKFSSNPQMLCDYESVMEADARKAVASLNRHKLNGRAIEVSLAKPKHSDDRKESHHHKHDEDMEVTSHEQSEPQSKETKASKPEKSVKTETDSEKPSSEEILTAIDITRATVARRTVVVTGLPTGIEYKHWLKKFKKYGRLEGFEYPSPQGPNTAFILYPGADQAATALTKLKDFTVGGKKPADFEVKMFSTARVNQFRVIVRNLPFKCTEELLRKTFSQFGEILQIDLPPGDHPGTNRGFGFVTFTNMPNAEKAAKEGSKLKILGRAIAVDVTVGRDQLKKGERHVDHNQQDDEEKSSKQKEKENKKESKKDKKSEKKNKKHSSEEEEDEEEEQEQSEEMDNDKEPEDEDSEVSENEEIDSNEYPSTPDFETEDEDEDEDEDNKDKENDQKKSKKQYSSDVHLGQTLFLRNVSFDTTESELIDKFSEWGPLKHAKIVVDPSTGEPRGTAFVHFLDSRDADKCLKDAYRSAKFANIRNKKSDENQLKESDIVLGGRHLIIDLAITKKTADQLTEEKKAKRAKASDTRNLALAELSTLSQAQMAELTKAERDKYERGQHEKNTKLANPNFHVSRTRLCIRNLPKTATEDTMKKLFKEASASAPGKPSFHQVKIVRDPAKGDASRGYGFVEFTDHIHALTALQALHHKHNRLTGKNRLFVEFAVEDSRVLQAREFRLQKTRKNKSEDGDDAMEVDYEQKSSKRKSRSESAPSKKRKRDDQDDQEEQDEVEQPTSKRQKTSGGFVNKPRKDSKNPHQGTVEEKPKRTLSLYNKGAWNAPSENGRRAAKSLVQKKQEAALEQMINQYQKELGGDNKRWFS